MSHGHVHKKSLGQHFLVDQSQLQRIVDCINPAADENIVEIGSGEGVLTDQLVGRCHCLTLVELDDRLIARLKQRFSTDPSVAVVHGNALVVDYSSIRPQPLRIVGNLPYNIASQLILNLVSRDGITDMHFVIQREMAQRLAASAGNGHFGRLTLMAGLYSSTDILFDIAPESFQPPPKVWSSMIRIRPHACPLSATERKVFADLVRAAFSQRRKQIANSLKNSMTPDQFKQLSLDSTARPQDVTADDYRTMAQFLVTEQR